MDTDVDYKVFENISTKKIHLVIYPGPVINKNYKTTVCGMDTFFYNFRYDGRNMVAFWKSPKRCKNCARAAKH